MSAKTAQVTLDFNDQNSPARRRIVRTGAEARYNEALAYLRVELKSGKFERINAVEFSTAFNITSTFLTLAVCIGAIESARIGKKPGLHYKALDKLATVTGKDLLKIRLTNFPNPPYTPEPAPVLPEHLAEKTPEQRNEFANAMNVFERMTNTETGVIAKPGLLQHELHGEKPTFLVGSLEAGNNTVMKLQTCANAQFHDLGTAKACMEQYPTNIGSKIVIVQVIEVVQRTLTLQPAVL